MDRHAPPGRSPVQPTDVNLTDGMHLYQHDCAMCHTSPQHPEKNFGHPFYPPAPDFLKDAPNMEENQNYYIIKHGTRWTAMPAWGKYPVRPADLDPGHFPEPYGETASGGGTGMASSKGQ